MNKTSKKINHKFSYIEPEPISFILGLLTWAILVFSKLDSIETIVSGIALLLYGYSISYGSKNYKKQSEDLRTKR